MRIGAIFARGSCRALKWMALVGMVFVLGSAHAAAQDNNVAPEMTAAAFKPGSATVTITMNEKVWGGGDAVSAANFSIDGATNAGTAHTVPASLSLADTTFTVTFTTAFDTGANPTVVYTAPNVNVGGHIVDIDGAVADRLDDGSEAATEQDIVPVLPDLATFNQMLRKDVAIEAIVLPEVVGGDAKGSNGVIAYSASNLPAGLTFAPATRQITGTPTAVTAGAMTVTYIAADNDANVDPMTPDTATGTFTITVQDRPSTPAAPTVTATTNTSGSLDVMWTAPSDNNSPILYYVVEYRTMGGTWVVVPENLVGTMTTVDGLTNGTTYEFHVQALNGVGRSDWSPNGSGVPMAAAPSTTAGQITEISVDGSDEKAVGGVKRQHVTEGVLTEATVKIRWSHAQLRTLWAGVAAGSKPPDVPVILSMTPLMSAESWLSEAETETAHDDVTIGTAAMVVVPKKPTSATSVGYDEGTGSTTIHFGLDPDAEAEAFELMVENPWDFAAGSLTTSKVHVIEDIDPQNIVLKRDGRGVIYEGRSDVKFDVTADPPREDLDLAVRFDLEDITGQTVASRDNYIDKSIGTIPTGTGPAAKDTVTLTLDNNDGNRDDDELALHAEVVVYALDTGAYEGIDDPDPEEITVVDVHKLPPLMVSPMTAAVAEGGKAMLTYTINRNPPDTIVLPGEVREYTNEPLTITLMGGGDATAGDDYRIMDMTLDVPKHSGKASDGWMQEAEGEVEIMMDEDIEGMETLMLDATVTGNTTDNGTGSRMDAEAVATLTINDATDTLVSMSADAYEVIKEELGDPPTLQKGMSGTLTGADLFDYDATAVSVAYGTAVLDGGAVSASASGGTVTIMGVSAGTAKVEITATATPNASSLIPNQTKANVAQITFPVTVDLADLSVAVVANPMEIMEGGMSTITATASRVIDASDPTVKIDLDVVGDATLSAASITIAAGMMTGSATLTATEDDDDYMDETVTVVASGSGITGTTQVAIAVIDNDDPPPPPAATVTAKSEAEVQAVFDSAVADARTGPDWVEGGAAAMVDMSMLFTVAEGAMPAYSGMSSDEMVVSASSSGMTLTLMPVSDGMATITVTAVDSASGDSATASGMVTVADLTFTIEMVSASAAMVEEGMSITITATGNKMVEGDNVEVMLMRDGASTASLDDYELDPPLITIMTGDDMGELTLMAEDDVYVEGMERLTLVAMMDGMNVGSPLMIEIADNDMESTFTLSVEDGEMNLVEGESYELTVMADPAVPMDTEVTIMRDRSMSDADEADFTAEAVMIPAGETMGTTMLMIEDDGPGDAGHGMPEMLVLFGMVDGMETNSLTFYTWDMAVPALPLIAQLLLAVFLAIGGYRRYLRR